DLGHLCAARWFGWRIRGVMLWVFGGVMDTDEHGTRPFHEEVCVALAGPLQHGFVYLFLFMLSGIELLPAHIIETAYFYNTVILLFNLLPIWPQVKQQRSEEHTSELQSRFDLVCRLLLATKKEYGNLVCI